MRVKRPVLKFGNRETITQQAFGSSTDRVRRYQNSKILSVVFALALAGPISAVAATTTCHTEDIACLIAAIHAANTNGAADNTIILDAGTYTLTAIDNDT